VPIATTAEQLALQAAIRDWAKRSVPLAQVRAQEPGADPAAGLPGAWKDLAALGVFSIALPAGAGAGGTVADLATAAEELARALAPGPVLPALLAGLVLREHSGQPAARALLPALAAGDARVATALRPGLLAGEWAGGQTLRVTGHCGPILGGDSAAHLLLSAITGPLTHWFLIPAGHRGVRVTSRPAVDFSRPLASVRLDGADIEAGQLIRGLRTERVADLAATLAAAEAAGVAGWCCDIAAAHARIRRQFGRPVGAFQAVKHLCAGMLVRAERAGALAWDAARAADEAPAEHPLAAAAAAAVALDAAVDNAKDCIQVLGGIGFTWEHDAHLYLRRALSLRALLGGTARWQARAAELTLAGARRHLAVDPGAAPAASTQPAVTTPVSTAPASTAPASTAETDNSKRRLEQVARAAREAAASAAALPPEQRRAALADAGYAAPHWPPPYGLGASAAAQLVIDAELDRAGLARPDLVIGGWAGAAIVQHGTPAQRDRFLGPTLRGEITWCQLFSEPEAGSDLASLRTRAERTDSGWRLTGQKVWTSLARQAGWAICLARSDPAELRHRGLTFFLVDMTSSGIDVRPLRELTGRVMFNEVFLDQVLVPDDCVVGGPGEGWRVARSTLAAERAAMGGGSALGGAVESLIDAVRDAGLAADPVTAGRLGALVADGLAVSLLDLRATLARLRGADAGQLGAVCKLAGVEHRQAAAEAALVLCGAEGAAADGPAAAAVHDFLLTRCLSIAGGTTQILLSVVAERGLGLPREELPREEVR
jgi:3-oxochol-4-en-24-oyl-CoA dehydrogenase